MELPVGVLVGSLILFGFRGTEAAIKEGLNAKPYGILCNIYNVAANPPNALYDPSELEKIQADIDVLNVSLSDDLWFEEIKKADTENDLPADFKDKNDVSRGNWDRWKKASRRLNGTGAVNKISSSSPAVKIAQAQMNKIESRVEKLIKKITEANTSAELEEIKKDFDAAIGSPGNDGKYGLGTRGTDCGGNSGAKGGKAGSTLIADFLCLCAAHTHNGCGSTSACGKECVDTGATSGANTWATGTLRNADAIWNRLKDGCERSRIAGADVYTTGQIAIGNFLAVIREHQNDSSGTSGKKGLLGTCVGVAGCSTGCTGETSSNNGICVSYGDDASKWEATDNNGIAWLKSLKSGLARFPKIKNITLSIHSDIAQVKMLKHRAEEIYEETKTAVELEKAGPEKATHNQNQKQNPATSTDKSTAQDATYLSVATVPRFIFPWTILI